MVKVITYGTFDLFHEGHYRLLKRAKDLGDYLIVGVTTEAYDKTRGKLNVVDSLVTRIENVKKTGFADEIVIEESQGQKVTDIRKFNVDIFAIGSDWIGAFDYLKDYCKVVYLERTKNISSTMLREKNRPIQRIGIIGTGRIAERFIPEAKLVSGVSTQGVYNPHTESAARFANQWEISAYENIEDFMARWMLYISPLLMRLTMDILKMHWSMGNMCYAKSLWCLKRHRQKNCLDMRESRNWFCLKELRLPIAQAFINC